MLQIFYAAGPPRDRDGVVIRRTHNTADLFHESRLTMKASNNKKSGASGI